MIIAIGGSGFIGSHLCKKLREYGFDFLVFDIKKPNFECNFFKGDVRNINNLLKVIDEDDIVIHLAALTNAHESDRKKEEYFSVNVKGTFNVVRSCELKKAEKLVFASSVAVFDPNLKGTVNENSRKKPQNFYGLTKLIGEKLIENSRLDNYAILRFTNVYGKGGRGVINKFVERALKEEPLEIWGSGKQKRDFLNVEDAVDAILLAIEKGHGIYNVSYGKNISIIKLAKLVKKITRSKSEIVFKESLEVPVKYRVSHKKINKELGWKPKINLKEGIARLVK